MLYPSNTLTVPSTAQIGPATFSGPGTSGAGPRVPPDILTYSYASRMVYVTPGETYDHAIDIAKESFLELEDIERERISLEVHVVVKNQQARRTAEIGRTAWSVVIASLARFEIVEIRVAPMPPNRKAAVALSSSPASSIGPPPYASENGSSWYSDSGSNLSPHGPQITSSQSSSSFATRVVDLLTHKSSRGRLSPQPSQHF